MVNTITNSILERLKNPIRQVIPKKIRFYFFYRNVEREANNFGLSIKKTGINYSIRKERDEIRVSGEHSIYLYDIIRNFEFYFSGVRPIRWHDTDIVDFSTPRWHWVTGFEYFPILFPSFVEPIVTTKQYIEFADLKNDSVVIDLGAYSGLTSILFDMAIPTGGHVISLEADRNNAVACRENLLLYERYFKRKIKFLEMAIWKNDLGVNFSSEGNMGSSVVDIVGPSRGENIIVPSLTLTQLAQRLKLEKIDFIKCDIEGGETEIFDAPEFFSEYLPKILIECHFIDGKSTTEKRCREVLEKYGYTCDMVEQQGYPLPLLMCRPPKREG